MVTIFNLFLSLANQEHEGTCIQQVKSGHSTALLPETTEQLRDMINNLTVKQLNMPDFFVNGFLQLRLKRLEEHKKGK